MADMPEFANFQNGSFPLINNGSGNRNRSGGRSGSGNRNGSGNLNDNGSRNAMDVFQSIANRQFLNDNRFSMDYPLLSQREFERDPTKLVGNEKSFFASSSSGSSR